MAIHLQRQIQRLKKQILELGAIVEENFQAAVDAILNRDPDLAKKVIAADHRVDEFEIDIEEECLHTLALHQPVAFDIRFVVAILKINSDLERVGDLSVNLAELAGYLSSQPEVAMPFDLSGMAMKVRAMLKKSLNALVNVDVELAESVQATDDEVDHIHRSAYERVQQRIRDDPSTVEQMIELLNACRHLERIADHAVAIAGDVLYMAKGDILRHARKRRES